MIFKCLECGKEFSAKPSSERKYCSVECAKLSRSIRAKKNIYICPECGKRFYRAPHHVSDKHKPYCSVRCWNNYQARNQIDKICIICGKKFRIGHEKRKNSAKYCSVECRNIGFILFPPRRRHEITDRCAYCGKLIGITERKIGKRNFCSIDCANLSHSLLMLGKNNPNYKDGNGDSRHPPEFNNRLKEKIRDRDHRICRICGKTESENGQKLDVHHIDYNPYNQCELNLISLCKVCHSRTNGRRSFWQLKLSKMLGG